MIQKASTPINMPPNAPQMVMTPNQPHPQGVVVGQPINRPPQMLMGQNQMAMGPQTPLGSDNVDASGQRQIAVGQNVLQQQQQVIKTEVMTSTTGNMEANFTDILDTIINDDKDLLEGMDDIINGVFTDESQVSR